MRSFVKREGLEEKIEVDSAGILNYHQGELPDSRMRMHAYHRGYELTHRSRPVCTEDFLTFDMIIGMDDRNIQDLKDRAPSPEAEKKIHRMTDYCRTKLVDYVPDPYYEGREGFELVLDLLEDGCEGVLLSEMPASFEKEALKAQAVAARTYALKCHVLSDRHMGAVCTQSTCCQGYLSIDAYLKQGGDEDVVEEYRLVVAETAGEVLTYEGDLIVATYFSCSGGRTESALSVWGQDYPYLQSVESPGEENATYFADEKTFAPEQLAIALGNTMNEDPATWIGEAIYTEGGGIAQLVLGGVSYRGTTLRSLLGLRSTCFSVEYIDGMFRFSTSGYGHRVGMSQYGANAMALSGADYMAILQHYYPSTEIIHYLQIHP